jgi:RNA polymerase sigma-70 factor, ECF subfamily
MDDDPDLQVLKIPLDSVALGELYDRFYEAIYRYCLRRLYFRHVAEDAVSGVFLTMAQRHRDFRGRTLREFRAWLYAIAGNHVSQVLRQKLRHDRLLEQVAEHARTQQEGSQLWRWTALYRTLLTLDEEQQHLLNLRFFEKLSHDEIAGMVGSSAGTVRVKIHRALNDLRPTLQRELDDQYAMEINDGH